MLASNTSKKISSNRDYVHLVFNPFFSYVILMLFGIASTTYIFGNAAVMWALNFAGLCVLFYKSFFHPRLNVFVLSFFYLFLAVITIWVNADTAEYSFKGVGININTVAVPLFWLLLSYESRIKRWNEDFLELWLKFISFLGLATLLYALFSNAHDIVRILRGSSAYIIKNYAFFYNKNAYGIFIALSFIADLYLYLKTNSKKHIVLLIIKFIGVLFSFCRAALMLIVLVFGINSMLNAKKRHLMLFSMLFVLIVLAVAFASFNTDVLNFIATKVLRLDLGSAGRISIFTNALIRFGESVTYYIFGVGYFTIVSLNMDIDNAYLYLLFSGGILKILVYLCAYFFSLKHILRLRKKNILVGNLCLSIAIAYLPFAFVESVVFFELGLANFLFCVWLFIIPLSYCYNYCEHG